MNPEVMATYLGVLFVICVLGIAIFLGFIIGRLTCPCRRELREIKKYRRDVGLDLEKPPRMESDDETWPLDQEPICGQCGYFAEEGEDNTGFCDYYKTQPKTGRITIAKNGPCKGDYFLPY